MGSTVLSGPGGRNAIRTYLFRISSKRVQYRGYNVMWKMIVGSRVQLGDEKGM